MASEMKFVRYTLIHSVWLIRFNYESDWWSDLEDVWSLMRGHRIFERELDRNPEMEEVRVNHVNHLASELKGNEIALEIYNTIFNTVVYGDQMTDREFQKGINARHVLDNAVFNVDNLEYSRIVTKIGGVALDD